MLSEGASAEAVGSQCRNGRSECRPASSRELGRESVLGLIARGGDVS